MKYHDARHKAGCDEAEFSWINQLHQICDSALKGELVCDVIESIEKYSSVSTPVSVS